MDFELEPLIEKDYEELNNLFTKFSEDLRIKKERDYAPFDPEFTKYDIERTFLDKGFFLGIFSNNKLVGTIGAVFVPVSFRNSELMSSSITFYSMDPDISLTRENQISIFQQVIDKIKEAQIDFIWVVFDESVVSKEEKIFRDELQFIKVNKNVEPLTKLLGSDGVELIKEKRGLNPVLAQLAKLMAKMQTMPLPGGTIRDATPEDYPTIVELLNAYSKELTITQIWSVDSLENYIKIDSGADNLDYSALKSEFPDAPFGFYKKVWERDDKLIAALIYRVMKAQFKNGKAPVVFWDYLAFAQDLDLEGKKAFVVNNYNVIAHKAAVLTCFFPFYDTKALKDTGFMSSQMKTPMYILPLTENAKPLAELKRIPKFYLPYMEFLV